MIKNKGTGASLSSSSKREWNAGLSRVGMTGRKLQAKKPLSRCWEKKEKSNFELSGILHRNAVQNKLLLLIKSYIFNIKEGKKAIPKWNYASKDTKPWKLNSRSKGGLLMLIQHHELNTGPLPSCLSHSMPTPAEHLGVVRAAQLTGAAGLLVHGKQIRSMSREEARTCLPCPRSGAESWPKGLAATELGEGRKFLVSLPLDSVSVSEKTQILSFLSSVSALSLGQWDYSQGCGVSRTSATLRKEGGASYFPVLASICLRFFAPAASFPQLSLKAWCKAKQNRKPGKGQRSSVLTVQHFHWTDLLEDSPAINKRMSCVTSLWFSFF